MPTKTEDGVTFINLEPTADGYKQMKIAFQQSIDQYNEKLDSIEHLRENDDALLEAFDSSDNALIYEGLCALEAQTEESIRTLSEGIAELERCGY